MSKVYTEFETKIQNMNDACNELFFVFGDVPIQCRFRYPKFVL